MEIVIKKNKKERTKDLVWGIIILLIFTYGIKLFNISLLSAFAPFIFALFICHYILSYTQSVHTYTFGEEMLIIDRKTGYRETNLLKVDYEDIEYVTENNEKVKNYIAGRFEKSFYILKLKDNKKIRIHKNDRIIKMFETSGVKAKWVKPLWF